MSGREALPTLQTFQVYGIPQGIEGEPPTYLSSHIVSNRTAMSDQTKVFAFCLIVTIFLLCAFFRIRWLGWRNRAEDRWAGR